MEGWCNFTPVNLISGWYGGAMMQLYTCILGIRLIYWRDDATLHLQTLYLVGMVVGWCNFTPVYLVSGWYIEGMMQLYTCITSIWLIYLRDDATLHLYTWYLVDMVVGWCNTNISPSNSQQHWGFTAGDTITIPCRETDYKECRVQTWKYQGNLHL